MTEREAFIRKICEEPFEDTHRLVFADWLEENEERTYAEFIRIACGRENPDPHYPGAFYSYGQHRMIDKRLGFFADVMRLLRKAGNAEIGQENFGSYSWNEQSDGSVYMEVKDTRFTIRKGFVSDAALTYEAFMRHHGELFAAHPITSVKITDFGFHETLGRHGTTPDSFWIRINNYESVRAGRVTYLPVSFKNHTRGGDVIDYGDRRYETLEEARKELSAAFVRWGREHAKLPQLDAVEVPARA